MAFRLGDLADRLGAELIGDPDRVVQAMRGLTHAGDSDLSVLTSLRYLTQAQQSQAGAILVPLDAVSLNCDLLRCADPSATMVDALELFHPAARPAAGIDDRAVVGTDCEISPTASIGPYVVIGAGCSIDDNAVIHPHVAIGANCRVGRAAGSHSRRR